MSGVVFSISGTGGVVIAAEAAGSGSESDKERPNPTLASAGIATAETSVGVQEVATKSPPLLSSIFSMA